MSRRHSREACTKRSPRTSETYRKCSRCYTSGSSDSKELLRDTPDRLPVSVRGTRTPRRQKLQEGLTINDLDHTGALRADSKNHKELTHGQDQQETVHRVFSFPRYRKPHVVVEITEKRFRSGRNGHRSPRR